MSRTSSVATPSKAAIKQINLLVDQGLLAPQDNPLDALAAVFRLSPARKATYAAISSPWAQRVEVLRSAICDAEIASALDVLAQLAEQLEKISKNMRDGLKLTGRLRPKKASV